MAVGKSSVGSLLAGKLNFSFFDTGLIYRTFTWKVLKLGVSPRDENALCHLASISNFDFIPGPEGNLSILIDGEDVSSLLASSRVEGKVPLVAKLPGVRQKMVSEQRRIARRGRVVMAGRDIGTVVLPWAELKIFLTAPVEVRAMRRYKELLGSGRNTGYDVVLAELKRRDHVDINRSISPLKAAADAVIIDTEKLELEQVADKIYNLAAELNKC